MLGGTRGPISLPNANGDPTLYTTIDRFSTTEKLQRSKSINNIRHSTGSSTLKGKKSKAERELFQYVHENVIGSDAVFTGPFGPRKVLYCDYTASGRSLKFIEDYIRDEVLPSYGNTHTTTSVCSNRTTRFREEATQAIAQSVHAGDEDLVLFTGSGTTAAVHKIVHVFALQLERPPVVITTPFEHHSNMLPWREIGSEVITVHERADGQLDLIHLENILKSHQGSGVAIIGSFAAASNVTGLLIDVDKVTALCHRYNALAMWDYATAGPYITIDMNPRVPGLSADMVAKDAVFLSTHKFVGGVQTPGVLIAKKKLFINTIPQVPGGGTVSFVRREAHTYLKSITAREEGGTPSIVESIRAGLTFQLKDALIPKAIEAREHQLVRRAFRKWQGSPNLMILGSRLMPRLPVFSFLVLHPQTGRYLHHNYTCVILNDLFGIQARGGCACAGPYAMDLLGINEPLAAEYERISDLGDLMIKPGFARLNLPFFMDDASVEFVIEAVKMVAEHGWKLLPQYTMTLESARWIHNKKLTPNDPTWITDLSYKGGQMNYGNHKSKWFEKSKDAPDHKKILRLAKETFDKAGKVNMGMHVQPSPYRPGNEMRWYMLPSEAMEAMLPGAVFEDFSLPYEVVTYPKQSVEYSRGYQCKPRQYKSISGNNGDEVVSSRTDTGYTSDGTESVASDTVTDSSNNSVADYGYLWVVPPQNVMDPLAKCMHQFQMLTSGARVLLYLSGCRHSIAMLHALHQYQEYSRSKGVQFEFGAVTIDPQTNSYDPSPLKAYLQELSVPYFYEEQCILTQSDHTLPPGAVCSFCRRMKKARIYNTAQREGYNVLALGEHLDDLAGSFLSAMDENNIMKSVKASYTVEGGLRVIRPFAYVREEHLLNFAESKLPVLSNDVWACFDTPDEQKLRRHQAELRRTHAASYPNILNVVKSMMGEKQGGVAWSIRNQMQEEDVFGDSEIF